jgi:hypothetical protein
MHNGIITHLLASNATDWSSQTCAACTTHH